jgi:cob(I)alamin adenosyltransferase
VAKARKSMLYTRSGDAGTTALFGGGRVPKDSPRVEAYGCVDELNSAIGVAASFVEEGEALASVLAGIQNELFNIGSELASEASAGKAGEAGHMFTDEEAKIAAIEALIDEYDARLAPLRTFILPSGGHAGAMLHLSRTVCRRAERAVVRLARTEQVNPAVLTYLNRLSDLLFALARYANKADGREEAPWRKG